MNDLLDFLLEADDEDTKSKKEEEDKKDNDDKKTDTDDEKETGSKSEKDEDDSDEYNDLMDDDTDSDLDSDVSDDELIGGDDDGGDSDMDDEYNDLMAGDDEVDPGLGDTPTDDTGTVSDPFEGIAKLGYMYTVLSNNMKHIHLNACGEKFEEIHNLAENFYYKFNDYADTMFELAAESPMIKLDNPTRAKEHVEDVEVESEARYEFSLAVEAFKRNLNKAIELVKSVRETVDRTDIQSKLDDQLSYLNKKSNYILTRMAQGKPIGSDVTAVAITTECYNPLF